MNNKGDYMLSFILGLLIGIFIWLLIDEYKMRRNSKFPSDEEIIDMAKEHEERD
tara:strand:+ start:906 stop:1067 length:162 start_codon:yes stop_codon:yes gene_type:complete